MRKLLLFSLLLFVVHTTTKAEELLVEMTTNIAVGNSISFQVYPPYSGTTINVDFGGGTIVPFISDDDDVSYGLYISGAVTGNTIKIYGEPTEFVGFKCFNKNLTSLDVSNCNALKFLDCYNNQLTSIDVSNCSELESLYCFGNKLTSLNVSNCKALEELWCHWNTLTLLDLSDNTALKVLYCYSNNLTSLDVSKNTALTELNCLINNFTFSSLPLEGLSFEDFFYAPQSEILIDNIVKVNTPIDLSAESEVNGNSTTFVWKDESGDNLVAGTDYTITDGVTTFLQIQQEKVFCEMTNPLFPNLTLKTTLTEVSTTTGVDEYNKDEIMIFSANRTIIVDTPNKGLLSVVDLSGRAIVQKNINPGRAEIPVAKNGIYIVTLSENGQKSSKKIIIE